MAQAALAALLGAAVSGVVTALALRRGQQKPRGCKEAEKKRKDDADGTPHLIPFPHQEWAPGKKQPMPYKGETWLPVDPAATDKAAVYALVISAFVPRPIALVSTKSKEGAVNLAPYSYFNAMGHNPPVLCIGINRSPTRGGGKKDTLVNIEETGEFVVNIMSDWYVEAANHSCGDFPPEVDEMALAGLTPMESELVKPYRLKEAAVHMECKLRQVVDVQDSAGKPSVAIVIGEVLRFHIHEAVAARSPTGKLVVDPVALRVIGRMGGVTYTRPTQLFELGRPTLAQAHQPAAEYTPPFKPPAAQNGEAKN